MGISTMEERREAYLIMYAHLLAVLQKNRGEWMTRKNIADALGTVDFNKSQQEGMSCLMSVGLVEAGSGQHGIQYRTTSKPKLRLAYYQILHVLTDDISVGTAKEIGEYVGYPTDIVRPLLAEMRKEGLVKWNKQYRGYEPAVKFDDYEPAEH